MRRQSSDSAPSLVMSRNLVDSSRQPLLAEVAWEPTRPGDGKWGMGNVIGLRAWMEQLLRIIALTVIKCAFVDPPSIPWAWM